MPFLPPNQQRQSTEDTMSAHGTPAVIAAVRCLSVSVTCRCCIKTDGRIEPVFGTTEVSFDRSHTVPAFRGSEVQVPAEMRGTWTGGVSVAFCGGFAAAPRRVCCCGPGGHEISIDCCIAGAQQLVPGRVCVRIGIAGSVVESRAAVGLTGTPSLLYSPISLPIACLGSRVVSVLY